MNLLYWILLMTGINGLLAFAGILSFLISEKKLQKILLFLVAFSVGALTGGAFFHLIPESLNELDLLRVALLVIVGFLVFLFIEKFLYWHHCHKNHCDEHPFTYLILFGDGIHNFIDGLIIASGFIISIPVGIITSILIMAHELPQEIGDFGVLVYGGLSRGKALIYNFLSQLTAVLGGILGFFFLGIKEQAVFLLPIAAGGFIYIAAMDLVPEVWRERNKKKRIINIIFIIIGLLVLLSAKIFVE
jgi:zinc and cadmium transporter